MFVASGAMVFLKEGTSRLKYFFLFFLCVPGNVVCGAPFMKKTGGM